jgi:hypothetical protein
MKKQVCVLLVLVLAVSFAVTALVSDVQAQRPCITSCIAGTWIVCCPVGSGWDCHWEGPCDWTPPGPW